MKRRLLTLLLAVACLILLIFVVLGVLLATLNPNDYKAQIAAGITKATGRHLIFEGDLTTSFFPSLGLKTGRLRLEDPPGFGQDPFVSVESASFSLALGPLFKGEARVEEVALQGVGIKLMRNSDGAANWEAGLVKPAKEGVQALDDPRPAAEPTGKGLTMRIDNLRCTDTTVTYRDSRAGASYRVLVKELGMDNVHFDGDIPVSLSGSMTDEASGADAELVLAAVLRVESAGNARLEMKKFEITAVNRDKQKLSFSLAGEARYTAQSHTLVVENIKGALAGASYDAGFTVLLPGAEGTAPGITHDVRGSLHLGKINLDALMPVLQAFSPPAKTGAGSPAGTAGGAETVGVSTPAGKPRPAENPMPGLYVDVQIAVDALTVSKLPMTDIGVRLVADKGAITAAPFSFKLFEGGISGNAGCDLRTEPPGVHAAAVVKGLQVKPLLQALAGKDHLSGVAGVDLDVQGKGAAWAEIAPSLQGTAKLVMTDGEVRGFNLIPADLPGLNPVPAQFPVDRLSASWVGSKGVFTSRDILLHSPALTVQGGGTVNLGRSSTSLVLDFLVGGLPPALPFKVDGPFSSLKYGVDMEAFLKNTATDVLRSPEKAGELLRHTPNKAGDVIKGVEGLFR